MTDTNRKHEIGLKIGRELMIKAVIFDLDGTLTEFNIRIDEIKRILGCRGPLLEFLMMLEEDERRRAEEMLRREEMRAAEECRLREDVKEVLRELKKRGLKLAILTRNNKDAVERVLKRFNLSFDAISTRDDGDFKPSRKAVERLLRDLRVSREEVIFIGDHEIDKICGEIAKVKTLIIGEDIKCLKELIQVVENENYRPLSGERV